MEATEARLPLHTYATMNEHTPRVTEGGAVTVTQGWSSAPPASRPSAPGLIKSPQDPGQNHALPSHPEGAEPCPSLSLPHRPATPTQAGLLAAVFLTWS